MRNQRGKPLQLGGIENVLMATDTKTAGEDDWREEKNPKATDSPCQWSNVFPHRNWGGN